MSIVLEKINETTIKAVVTVAAEEYVQDVDQQIKSIRKNIQMPGFRQGMVPRSIIEKKHGAQLRFEAISQKAFVAVEEQLEKENHKPMGRFAIEAITPDALFATTNADYTLTITVGIVAPYELELDENIELPYYSVDSVDEKVEETINQALTSLAKPEEVESATDQDALVYGTLKEVDADGNILEGGVQNDSAMIMPRYVENEEQIRTLTAKQSIVINPFEMYKGNESVIAHFLDIDKAEVENHKGNFLFEVTSITAPKKPELNEETFKQILGEETKATTEEEFRNEIAARLKEFQKRDSDYLFSSSFYKYLQEVEAPKVQLPEDRIKALLEEKENEQEQSEEDKEKSFKNTVSTLATFHIIDHLADKYNVEITKESVESAIRQEVMQSVAPYLSYLGEKASTFVEEMVSRRMKQENENRSVESSMRLFEVSLKAQSLIKLNQVTLSSQEYEEKKKEVEGANR